jgi:hypothetical protein
MIFYIVFSKRDDDEWIKKRFKFFKISTGRIIYSILLFLIPKLTAFYMRKLYPHATALTKCVLTSLFFIVLFSSTKVAAQTVTVAGSTGADGAGYTTLKAAFDALNATTSQTGNNITITVSGTTTEAASAILNKPSLGNWTSLKITGSGAASVTGNLAAAVIDLNGVSNVTIDGTFGGGSLTISNTSTGSATTSTIRFINDASSNTITNSTIMGSGTSVTLGTIFFSTGTATGNINNTIANNTITAAGSNLPVNGIFSLGTSATIFNSGTISGNNISDYFSASLVSSGINLSATNSGNSGWTITNNRLFQTATRTFTTSNTHNGIFVGAGSGYTISGNIIGFANAAGTGTTNLMGMTTAGTFAGTFPSAYTLGSATLNATRYIAINCAFTAGGTNSLIQTNTVAGIALLTSSGAATTNGILCGINVTGGNATIGGATGVLGNTIGVASGSSSLYAASNTAGGVISGIYASSANTVTIQNNTIGGIDVSGTSASTAAGFKGIDAAGAGNFSITDNLVGNAIANNIRTGYLLTGANLSNVATTPTTATGTSAIAGIQSSATGTTLVINTNTIRGIQISGSTSTFSGITSSGTMTGANPSAVINSNALGTAATGLVTYAVANS